MFALQEGQVSTVVNTGSGYHVVKLIQKLPKEYQPFSEVSERIKLQLEAENVQKLLPEYLDKLKEQNTGGNNPGVEGALDVDPDVIGAISAF